MSNLLNWSWCSNSGQDYLLALGILIGSLVILKVLQKIVITHLKKIALKTATDLDDILIDIVSKIKPPFYLIISLYLSLNYLTLVDWLSKAIKILFLMVLVYEGIQALQRLFKFVIHQALKKNGDENQAKATVKTLNIFIQIILWSIGLLLVLANMGVDITSLIAGLGIGGIAVALALQNILSDIFASFSILIDKPFQVGDFIKSGNDMGIVEKVGIKTTRLRTLDGQMLIISNQELTKARVENFQQLKRRRALFTLGIIYETDRKILEEIPKIIKDIVSKQEKVELDRCHFKSYGDFSLNFEVSLYIDVTSYVEFLDVLQAINLDIFSRFKERGINFAYPTQLEYQKNI